jgi:riboflavin biosynthesis pyrimidine reductase
MPSRQKHNFWTQDAENTRLHWDAAEVSNSVRVPIPAIFSRRRRLSHSTAFACSGRAARTLTVDTPPAHKPEDQNSRADPAIQTLRNSSVGMIDGALHVKRGCHVIDRASQTAG